MKDKENIDLIYETYKNTDFKNAKSVRDIPALRALQEQEGADFMDKNRFKHVPTPDFIIQAQKRRIKLLQIFDDDVIELIQIHNKPEDIQRINKAIRELF